MIVIITLSTRVWLQICTNICKSLLHGAYLLYTNQNICYLTINACLSWCNKICCNRYNYKCMLFCWVTDRNCELYHLFSSYRLRFLLLLLLIIIDIFWIDKICFYHNRRYYGNVAVSWIIIGHKKYKKWVLVDLDIFVLS